jgi:urea transport system substrate-binding protein
MFRSSVSRWATCLGLCALLIGPVAAPATTSVAAGTITVGSILDATGPINIYGKPMIDATKMAIDDINAHGGVLRRQLRLVQYDGQSTNDQYVQYASRLILQNKAVVVMGGITSASREAIRPLIDRYGMLYFYNEQYEGGVCDKYVFATGVVPEQQLSTLIPWAIGHDGPKIYTIAADYNYGHISADWVRYYARRHGGTVIGQEFIPLDVSDFGSTLNKIQKARPDVIMSLLVGGNHIAFYRQWAAAGLKSRFPVVSPTFGLGNEQIVLAPKEAQGIVVSYPYYQELTNPWNRAFVAAWHARYGATYPYITDSANDVWTGWHLWAAAATKAGSVNRDKVTAVLERGLQWTAPEGRVKLDPQTHHLVHSVNLARVNGHHGFTIIQTYVSVTPTWDQQVCNLIKNPDTHTQFTPSVK